MGPWTTVVRRVEDPGALEEALAWLHRSEVVAFPTDTVYGLGASIADEVALERLFAAKGRPEERGMPLLLADAEYVERFCREIPPAARTLMRHFWPGGLTLVLWRSEAVPVRLTGGQPTVAVRVPDHPVPRALARALGGAVPGTSANRSGEPAPATAREVLEQLGGRIPFILDGGRCRSERPSTVLDLTQDPPKILRSGPVSRAALEEVLGYRLAE
ncbi:MAG: L-threonylcarbamoyladenylate synthase [Chloroflexia bacterium]